MENIFYRQWLASITDVPDKAKKRILKKFPDPEELFQDGKEFLGELMTPAQESHIQRKLKETGDVAEMQREFETLAAKGIAFTALGTENYPERLSQIPDPPLGVYYMGKLPGDSLTVAIIGSRDCSEYGSNVARLLGGFLGERGVTVISGMARGIDGIAQLAALSGGGESYAVLGCGVDVCYPASNKVLYQKLIERGGILSTYPPGTPPAARNFPPRNRIVSGLANATVVVEAAMRSGTSITVSMALEQGRDVYVVPGRVTDRLSDGCNRLIKQGAEVFTDPESFLEEVQEAYFLQHLTTARRESGPGTSHGCIAQAPQLPPELMQIWAVLDLTPKSMEQIAKSLPETIPVQTLSIRLMELVLRGAAKQASSGFFCRNSF